MKKNNKKRRPRKELPTGILLILILLFAAIYLLYGICVGFLINALLNGTISEKLIYALFVLIVGIAHFIILTILMRNSDSENVQPLKWYINNILISLTVNLIITALTVITLQTGDGIINFLIGFAIFPFIGIITTPNIIKYVRKDTEKWKHIFYRNGNLQNTKKSDKYYRVKPPVAFEKKLLHAVYKNQFLNVLVVIGIMAVVIFVCGRYMVTDHSYTDNVVTNIMITKANRSFGFIFFLTLIFLAFGIPIIAFYISNSLKKIRTVRNHEYIVYHAIVTSVRNSKITIFDGNVHYTYKYCTCVGIKEKNINRTPATLIFVPDDVFLFPDNEKYKI